MFSGCSAQTNHSLFNWEWPKKNVKTHRVQTVGRIQDFQIEGRKGVWTQSTSQLEGTNREVSHGWGLGAWQLYGFRQRRRKVLSKQSIGGANHYLQTIACPSNALSPQRLPTPLLLDALSCYLSLVLKHSDRKLDFKKLSRSKFRGGARLLRPLWIRHCKHIPQKGR